MPTSQNTLYQMLTHMGSNNRCNLQTNSYCLVFTQFTLFLFLDFIIDVCRLLGLSFCCPFFFVRSYNSVLKLSRVHKAPPSSHRYRYYGGRRVEDFHKYDALRYAEELASVAKSSSDPKAAGYDIIALTSRENFTSRLSSSRPISSPCWPTRIFPVLSKRSRRLISPSGGLCHIEHRRVEEDCRQQPHFQAYQRPPPRVICYRCGEPGHKSSQYWKRAPSRQPSSSVPAQPWPPRPST